MPSIVKHELTKLPVKNYITDKNGNATDVIININDYNNMIALLEDMEDALTYKKIRKTKTSFVSLEDGLAQVNKKRAGK